MSFYNLYNLATRLQEIGKLYGVSMSFEFDIFKKVLKIKMTDDRNWSVYEYISEEKLRFLEFPDDYIQEVIQSMKDKLDYSRKDEDDD